MLCWAGWCGVADTHTDTHTHPHTHTHPLTHTQTHTDTHTHMHISAQSAEVSGYLTVDLQGDRRAFPVQGEGDVKRGRRKGEEMAEEQEVRG